MDWEIIFKAGGLAGLASLFWLMLKDLIDFCKKPRLLILHLDKNRDLRVFSNLNIDESINWPRNVATLQIRNKKNRTALRCVAKLEFQSWPLNVTHLERHYNLHWAGVPYSYLTSGTEPIDIGPEGRRLDVIFTHANQDALNIPGCWIGTPMALSNPVQNQFYLPPGEYKIKIMVDCENGKGDNKYYKIISPTQWNELDLDEL